MKRKSEVENYSVFVVNIITLINNEINREELKEEEKEENKKHADSFPRNLRVFHV